MMPRCAEVIRYDETDVIVHHRPPTTAGVIDEALERNWSQRYWSSEFPDSARVRRKDWRWPLPVGTIYAEPETYHGSHPNPFRPPAPHNI
jgi:hypothetical protein